MEMIKLDCLRIHDIIGCQRALWYKAHNCSRLLSPEKTAAGTELHKAIEGYLNGTVEYPEFSYEELNKKFENFLTFSDSLNAGENKLILEKRLYSKDTPQISGKSDLILGHVMYDWKSGNFWRKAYHLQMSGYAYLAELNDIKINAFIIVLLGGYSAVAHFVKPNINDFLKLYEIAKDTPMLINPPPQEWGEICGYCDYIHECRGLRPEY